MRKESLRKAELYLILDRQVNDDVRLFEITRESIRHGVDIIQLRDKLGTARDTLRCLCRSL
ncbi:MAG: thiamine phosphate synthase [Candidatus Omnitrophica bacterium]|nr:thiamine phosphate synthase [Candidatus Omnitrophota bacterium]